MKYLLIPFFFFISVFVHGQGEQHLLIRQLSKNTTYTAKKDCPSCEYVLFQVNYIEASLLDKPKYNRLIKQNKQLLGLANDLHDSSLDSSIETTFKGRFSTVVRSSERHNSSVVTLQSKTENSQQEHATIYYKKGRNNSQVLEKIVLSKVNMRSMEEKNFLLFHFY